MAAGVRIGLPLSGPRGAPQQLQSVVDANPVTSAYLAMGGHLGGVG